MENTISSFLLEEYKQLHESLFKSNEAIVTAIRFTITLLAAFSGAILITFVRESSIDKQKLFICVFAVSLFFFLLCLLGSFFLLNTFKNVKRMFCAINAIRSYYVSAEKIPKKFIVMPLSTSQQPHRRFGGWPAMYLAHIFGTLFLLVCSVALYLLVKPFKGSIAVLILSVGVTIVFSVLHGRFIEKNLKKFTTTSSSKDDTEITVKFESEPKNGKESRHDSK